MRKVTREGAALCIISRYVVRAAKPHERPRCTTNEARTVGAMWGWGKCKPNEAAGAVGRSRTVRAKQKTLHALLWMQTVARQEPSVTGRSAPTNEDDQDGRSELARRLLRSGTEPPGRRSAAQLQAT